VSSLVDSSVSMLSSCVKQKGAKLADETSAEASMFVAGRRVRFGEFWAVLVVAGTHRAACLQQARTCPKLSSRDTVAAGCQCLPKQAVDSCLLVCIEWI
jgi:hypothetical protein